MAGCGFGVALKVLQSCVRADDDPVPEQGRNCSLQRWHDAREGATEVAAKAHLLVMTLVMTKNLPRR